MASPSYDELRRSLSMQLFGQDIPIAQMTPDQLAQFQRNWNALVSDSAPATKQLQAEISRRPRPVDPASSVRAATVGQINDAGLQSDLERKRLLGRLAGEVDRSNTIDDAALGTLTTAQDKARGQYYGTAANVRNDATAANNLSAQLLGGYYQGLSGLNAQDQAGYDRYLQETNPLMTQLQARGSDPADLARQIGAYNTAQNIYGGSLDYTAAQYASNPADVQRQLASYNTLMGVGGGSLDYQAAQYASSPADLQRQLLSYNDLRGIGQGDLDYRSRAAAAYADPGDVYAQRQALADIRQDLKFGALGQEEVRDKFKALSDPQVTAKERFLSELARREFEAGDRSARGAISENLAMRGMRSGGQEIAQQQAARQQLSQDRLLKELGIQAQAVDRSMQALGGWGDAENSIRAGDQNALGMQAGLSTALRNASFDEEYKRGLADDAASANNQQTRLSGTGMAAQQGNAIRSANDQVGMFNTRETNTARANNQQTRLVGYQSAAQQSNAIRQANDYVGTFNVSQQNQASANNQQTRMQGAQLSALQSNAIRSANDSQRQYEDTYAQNEAVRVGNLAGQRQQAGLNTTAQIGGRVNDFYGAGDKAIGDAYNRNQDANKADWDATTQDLGMTGDYFNAVTGNADKRVGRASNLTGTSLQASAQGTDELIRRLGINNNQWAINQELALSGGGF